MKSATFAAAALTATLTLSACGDKPASGTTQMPPAATQSESAALKGQIVAPSTWRASAILGAPLVAGSTVSLAFSADGKVSGNATCNRFAGPVTLQGDIVKFGALAVTRMACAGEDLNQQEARFLKSLETAERATITGGTLEIYSTGSAEPSRFVAAAP